MMMMNMTFSFNHINYSVEMNVKIEKKFVRQNVFARYAIDLVCMKISKIFVMKKFFHFVCQVFCDKKKTKKRKIEKR